MRSIIKTLAVVSLFALAAACGDDDDETNTNANNNNGNGNGNNNNATPSLQQQAFDAGQIKLADGSNLNLDPATLAVSGIVPAAPATALPAGFETNNYYGAVDPASTTPFWSGWTAIDSDFDGNLPGADFHPLMDEIMGATIEGAATNACATLDPDYEDGGTVTVFGDQFPVCIVSDDIDSDVTWPNNHVFLLTKTINVGDGFAAIGDDTYTPLDVTLTIEPGTQVYALIGVGSGTATAAGASLVATRGSKIIADGTSELPIIMAAVDADLAAADVITGDPTDLSQRGGWGGLVLSGFGLTNRADNNGEAETEAAPADAARFYGGDDNNDNSGIVRYVVIAESGFAFREDQEVQGLTVEAAGSDTIIDFVQVIGANDDCIEWFGGAADGSHIVCVGVSDDGLDIDTGYVGFIQYALVRIGAQEGARGIESDSGSGSNFDLLPRSAPNIANLTVLGNSGAIDGDATIGALHREGIAPKVYRAVFTDDTVATPPGVFEAGCLDVDNQLQDELEYTDSVFNCSGGDENGLVQDSD